MSEQISIPQKEPKVLLVCDDAEAGRVWSYALGQRGLSIVPAQSAEQALACWEKEAFDLTVIDVHSFQLDGIGLCRQLTAETVNPVLLLTAESNEAQVLEAYKSGADECICKPISPALFVAKVAAWLHHSWTISTNALDTLQMGDLRLDPRRRLLESAAGTMVNLSNLEFRLLHLLLCHRGQVLETDAIVERVWGYTGDDGATLLKNLVYRLRRKIEPDPSRPQYIQTVSGVGYTFQQW